jgi:hypothetical protein
LPAPERDRTQRTQEWSEPKPQPAHASLITFAVDDGSERARRRFVSTVTGTDPLALSRKRCRWAGSPSGQRQVPLAAKLYSNQRRRRSLAMRGSAG